MLSKETLFAYPLVVTEIDEKDHNRLKDRLEELNLPYNVALEVGDLEAVKIYVARGHGIAVMPGMYLTPEDASLLHLIEVPGDFRGETDYGVILRRDKHISSSLRDLLSLLRVPEMNSPSR